MGFSGLLVFIALLPLFLKSVDAFYKYDILFRDEKIFSPCDIPNVHFLDEYFDLTNLFFEFQNDNSVYIHGEHELIKDLGTENNPVVFEVFKKIRGEWVNTIYSLRRPDLCTTLFDPLEYWYPFFEDIKDKTCQFHKGQIFNFNTSSILSLKMADQRLEGDFKIQILINFKELNEKLCLNAFIEVYKVQ